MYSFASSQATLPAEVIDALRRDFARPSARGLTWLELPFVGDRYQEISDTAEKRVRNLLRLAETQRVLFLQGGASAHFALLAMNFLGAQDEADYVESGHWSRRAAAAARRYGRVRIAARGDGFSLPPASSWRLNANAAYCHVTSNETAEGLQMATFADTGEVPLVADMTADLLTRVVAAERFGLIYASAQKNLGVAGLTLVIVDERLLARARGGAPAPFDYALQAAARGTANTPPTFAVAVAAEMLGWLERQGGVAAAAARNARKAGKLYAQIDADDFYVCPARAADRSLVSVCFRLGEQVLEADFLGEAEAQGLLHLAGHQAIGGVRASLYNGVAEEAVDALAGFMADFRRRKG